jgi:hypothetical protein
VVNRRFLSEDEAMALDSACDAARSRRERNLAGGHCINDNAQHTHERPEPGKTKCKWCLLVAKLGIETAAHRHPELRPAPAKRYVVRLTRAATRAVGGA